MTLISILEQITSSNRNQYRYHDEHLEERLCKLCFENCTEDGIFIALLPIYTDFRLELFDDT